MHGIIVGRNFVISTGVIILCYMATVCIALLDLNALRLPPYPASSISSATDDGDESCVDIHFKTTDKE